MKTETCKLYSSVFRIFLPNFIKIDLHNFELYGFKVGAFFGTQCSLYFSLHTVNRGTGLQQRVFFIRPHRVRISDQQLCDLVLAKYNSKYSPYIVIYCSIIFS